MNRFYPVLLLTLFFSCATQKPAYDPPSWIEGIRRGTDSFKIRQGDKFFYRRIYKSESNPKESCEKAVDLAEKDIKKQYPFFDKIPTTIELIYFDESQNDCAVTLSLPLSLENKLAEIDELNKKHSKNLFEVETKLSEARKERDELELKNKQLVLFISQNKKLFLEVEQNENKYNRIINAINDRTKAAQNYATNGMTKQEFESILNRKIEIRYMSQGTKCYSFDSSYYVSIHGMIHVCWTHEVITGFCNIKEGKCYNRYPQ